MTENGDAYASFRVVTVTNTNFYADCGFVNLNSVPITHEILTENLMCSWLSIGI